ncbi:MAG: hypothetical protein M0Q13_03630 [Methanothrix sp.]|nr:hypothetical protein [Methanothrix sp.]
MLEVYLGDGYGNHLQNCTFGSPVTAHLWIRVNNNANSERRAMILLADIYINDLLVRSLWAEEGAYVLDVVPPGTSLFDIYSFSYVCSQSIELKNFVLSWDTNGNTNKKCAERTTQCYRASTINAWIPLNPPNVQILGDNITCIANPSIYVPQITGQFIPRYQASWSIDGSEIPQISSNNSIDVNWELFGEGNHLLQLTINFIDEFGQVWYIDHSQMNVLVVDVPRADIKSV